MERSALADAHAAAHDDAIHERDIGLAQRVNQVVERIFLGEEIFKFRVALAARSMQKANVTACAEGTENAILVTAANRHRQNRVVFLPVQQRCQQGAHHSQRQRIERPGAVERNHAQLAAHFGNHIRRIGALGRRHCSYSLNLC